MWQFLLGFGTGVYIGTKYDCRPCMRYVEKHVEEYFPKKDENSDGENIFVNIKLNKDDDKSKKN